MGTGEESAGVARGIRRDLFKRFGSFPDEFCFGGGFEEGIRQIGNCVPPLFMRAISRHIREKILTTERGSPRLCSW